jgi:uncharacterized protein YeaO (DUF488 family)
MTLKIKRVYEAVDEADGHRFLVDRLWPRGIKKSALRMDGWIKDVAPSTELREWFNHEPAKWNEFRDRYFSELESKPGTWKPILDSHRHGTVTLLYSAKEAEFNQAVALVEFLKSL